jgi:hypothetical protein
MRPRNHESYATGQISGADMSYELTIVEKENGLP